MDNILSLSRFFTMISEKSSNLINNSMTLHINPC